MMRNRLFIPGAVSLILTLSIAASAFAMPAANRITLPDGRQVFLAGFNLAWINFGNDVGDTDLNRPAFSKAVRNVAASGGNVMRVWLSTNGANDPKFGSDGLVSGLGTRTIDNVKHMLRICKESNILLMPVLVTHNFMQVQGNSIENNRRMLTTDEGTEAYIAKALVPLVTAIGNDPTLVCWEVANEAEGMAEQGGWTAKRIKKADIIRFTNRVAGAIHRAVPGVLVSTGTVSADKLSWYDDDSLISSGGDKDGVLDFYMVHYYGWNGTKNSPFARDASDWGVDKPLVVGEMASSDWSPSTLSSNKLKDSAKVNDLLFDLWDGGYAGGLFWQYQKDGGDPWMLGFKTAGPALSAFTKEHPVRLAPLPSPVPTP